MYMFCPHNVFTWKGCLKTLNVRVMSAHIYQIQVSFFKELIIFF